MNVAATSGRLTSTAEPHQYRSSKCTGDDRADSPPAPAKPAHTPIARFRSSGGKIVVMIEASRASRAPRRCPSARPAMTLTCTRRHTGESDPDPNTTRPASNALACQPVAGREAAVKQRPGEHDGVRVGGSMRPAMPTPERFLHRGIAVTRPDRHHDEHQRGGTSSRAEPAAGVDAWVLVQWKRDRGDEGAVHEGTPSAGALCGD
jgi:hypothetical protein